jgi:hypothetical protein
MDEKDRAIEIERANAVKERTTADAEKASVWWNNYNEARAKEHRERRARELEKR